MIIMIMFYLVYQNVLHFKYNRTDNGPSPCAGKINFTRTTLGPL